MAFDAIFNDALARQPTQFRCSAASNMADIINMNKLITVICVNIEDDKAPDRLNMYIQTRYTYAVKIRTFNNALDSDIFCQ
ncbi:hypothetical protein PS15m_001874 [Mucor circinelloides]